MTFLDLFAGIGGFRRGMELAGHKCIGFCEWDKYARASYISMHCITEEQRAYLATLDLKKRQKEILKNEYLNGEWCSDDIRAVDAGNIPKADCWCFGAPCQDFSVAGKRAGLDGDRSSLVREVFRILNEIREEDRPEWLVYENVKGMLSSNRGFDFLSILLELEVGGYDIEWQLLNSKLHGVPQNRERVYTIGHLRRRGTKKVFPISAANGKDCMEHEQTRQIGAKLFKQFPGEKFLSMDDAFITDVGTDTASTVTDRYYKGLGNHKDNMILEKAEPSQIDIIGHRDNYRRNMQTYSPDGLTETLDTCTGGAENHTLPLNVGGVQDSPNLKCNRLQELQKSTNERCFGIDKSIYGEPRPVANTLTAREDRGISSQKQTGTAIAYFIGD